MSELQTILICDDEPALREMVSVYLSGRGYKIEEAENPPAMRAKLEEALPDLIILDINMPGEDGLTALRTLRMDLDTPVIMLTSLCEDVCRPKVHPIKKPKQKTRYLSATAHSISMQQNCLTRTAQKSTSHLWSTTCCGFLQKIAGVC